MPYDLITFGEAMIRLVPPHFLRLEQASSFEIHVGGAELNVAVAAQRLGLAASFVTRLTRNPLGRLIVNKIREQGVDTSRILWTTDDRVGLYFAEFGASPRPSTVLYDRQGSAMAAIRPGEVDWENTFRGGKMFHVTGITPALSATAQQVTQEAVAQAKAAGLLVSIDLNYRANLWPPDKARHVMTGLLQQADILITTEEDTERVFGIQEISYERVAERLAAQFDLAAVAITLRQTPSVWRNQWSAIVFARGDVFRGPEYDIEIVDRVGAGDAFAGGFLAGYLWDGPALGVRYGVALSALKQTNPGDFVWATREEVERLLKGASLRIAR